MFENFYVTSIQDLKLFDSLCDGSTNNFFHFDIIKTLKAQIKDMKAAHKAELKEKVEAALK